MTAPQDAAVPMRLRISSNARSAPRGLFWQAARVIDLVGLAVGDV
jgi:hypothetical protein